MNDSAPHLPFDNSQAAPPHAPPEGGAGPTALPQAAPSPTPAAPAPPVGLPDAPGPHGQPGRKKRRRRKPDLGDVPYTKNSDTSKATAESMRRVATGLSLTIMEFVTEAGERGLTSEECGLLLGQKRGANPYVFNARQTAASRLSLLLSRGDVADSGRRRMTASNRPAMVHVLPKYGPPPAPPQQPAASPG